MSEIKPRDLLLRCYIIKYKDQWQAFCIDLNLAAQGDSLIEVKAKLESMIETYVYDALVGDDKEYADQLLNRKAPFKFQLTYYAILFLHYVGLLKNGFRRTFKEPMPLVPQHHIHA